MPDLADGQSVEIQGSAAKPYVIKNLGGVYSCSCPSWRNQSLPVDCRTCNHIRQVRGEAAEHERIGQTLPESAAPRIAKQTAPALLLAHSWDNEQDLTGWWLSEKLDGVRCYWTGKVFLSRQGNRFYAPDWFLAGLPHFPLDGELWIDRKAFQRTVSTVRRQNGGDHWREVKYLVFDAPAAGGPFEERMGVIADALARSRAAHAMVHAQVVCRGVDDLRRRLAEVESAGGEGLMLRQPGSRYEAGRSSTLLKVKTFRDAEARVIEHLPGAGRHKGRMGALLVELPNGKQFSVGTGFTDAQRSSPPAIGSVITFRYQELTDGGVPRFPTFVRVRADGQA